MLVVALLETVHTMAHGQQQQRGPWLVLDAQVAVAAGMIPHHSCCVSCGVDCVLGRDLLALHNLGAPGLLQDRHTCMPVPLYVVICFCVSLS
jgi:hypothetical protein